MQLSKNQASNSSLMLRRNQFQNRRAYKTGGVFSVGPTTVRYLVLTLLAAFSLLFLIQSAQGSDGIIELRNLERQQSEANKELTSLEVNASRLQSLQSLSGSATTQGLVPLENNPAILTIPSN